MDFMRRKKVSKRESADIVLLSMNTIQRGGQSDDRMSINSYRSVSVYGTENEVPLRSRERRRKQKDQAPHPPSLRAPSLQDMALKMDPRNYKFEVNNLAEPSRVSNNVQALAVAGTSRKAARSASVDRAVPLRDKGVRQTDKGLKTSGREAKSSSSKMPPAKGFFKSLLKKGKSKHDVSAPEFESIEEPRQNGNYHNSYHHDDHHNRVEDEEQDLDIEGKLPKEFLDTWVSSTTHQLLDEMDQALKGVWPYDKKEDSLSGYPRRSSSNSNLSIAESGLTEPSQTNYKRRSKVPSSGWSDRGGTDTIGSSNYILKEKTKKSSTGSTNGSLKNFQPHYKSTSSLHSTSHQRPASKTPAAGEERRSSKPVVTEPDGSVPKSAYREQFLKKFQQDGYSQSNSGTLKKKNVSSERLTVAPQSNGTINSQIMKSHSSSSNNSSKYERSLSASGTPTTSVTQRAKSPAVPVHGRQSSVPGSTYSGSSSGQSGAEYRSKEDVLESKRSPLVDTVSPAHDSGYESGTVRSRRQETMTLSQDTRKGRHEYDTLRPKKEGLSLSTQARTSGYESSTLMRPRKEPTSTSSTSADYATLKRVKRSPTLSLTSRSTPRGSNTAIDSIPLCFEQLTAMNVTTLQQLCALYVTSQKNAVTERQQKHIAQPTDNPNATEHLPGAATSIGTSYRWYDIGLIDELTPLFVSNKVVLYKAYWRHNPQDTFTVMLSLKEPAKLTTFKPNLMAATTTFEANVAPHLIPSSLYAGQKLMKSQQAASSKQSPMPVPSIATPVTFPVASIAKPAKSVVPARTQSESTNFRKTLTHQRSVDESLLQTDSRLPKSSSVNSFISQRVSSYRDSVFTNQSSEMSQASSEQIEAEQAAVDSILLAVAGEDDAKVSKHVEQPSKLAKTEKTVKSTTPIGRVSPKLTKVTPKVSTISPKTQSADFAAKQVESTAHKSSTVNKLSATASPAARSPILRSPAVPAVAAPPESTLAVVTPPAIRSPVVTPLAVRSPVASPPAVGSPVVTPPAVRSPVVTPPAVRSPVVTPPAVRSPVVTPPAVRPPVASPPAVRSPVASPPAVRSPVTSPPVLAQTRASPPDSTSVVEPDVRSLNSEASEVSVGSSVKPVSALENAVRLAMASPTQASTSTASPADLPDSPADAIFTTSGKPSVSSPYKSWKDSWQTTKSSNALPEPVKLSSKFEAFSSSVKKPIAERYTSGRASEPAIPNTKNGGIGNGSIGRRVNGISGLKTAGMVKNRIANLNSNNNNNGSDDEDEELFLQLNSNNNNNMDDMLEGANGGAEGEFVFASHLMEMAGGEMFQQMEEDEAEAPTLPSSASSTAAALTRLSCADKVASVQNVTCFVTILPALPKVETLKNYLERLKTEQREKEEFELDVIFILLQMLSVIFGLHECHLRLDSISMSDFIVMTDADNISTLHCHMINVAQASQNKISLTCEKLRMFLMQLSHSVQSLQKSVLFTTIDDLVQNSEDLGDLKTIYAILQYLLWGPKDDEVKVITLAEHRRQAFELWLQLARGKLISGLALKPIDNLKAYMVTNFLANSNGSELFKITKLLNTY